MLIIRGILNVNTLLSLGGFVLCLMLMLQFKQIYNNHEKNNRLQGYKQFMHEISEELSEIEKSANKSSTYIHQLNEAIFKQRERKVKNITQSQLGNF